MGLRLRWISQMIECDDAAEDGQGQQEDQKDPAVSSDGCDIAGHAGLRVAAQVPADRGQIARHLGAALDPGIAADGGNVSRDRGAGFGNYASGDSRDVAGYLSADIDGAADAGHVADFFSRLDMDVMVHLEAVGSWILQGWRRVLERWRAYRRLGGETNRVMKGSWQRLRTVYACRSLGDSRLVNGPRS